MNNRVISKYLMIGMRSELSSLENVIEGKDVLDSETVSKAREHIKNINEILEILSDGVKSTVGVESKDATSNSNESVQNGENEKGEGVTPEEYEDNMYEEEEEDESDMQVGNVEHIEDVDTDDEEDAPVAKVLDLEDEDSSIETDTDKEDDENNGNVNKADNFMSCMIGKQILSIVIDEWEFSTADIGFKDAILNVVAFCKEQNEDEYESVINHREIRPIMQSVFKDINASPDDMEFRGSVQERLVYKMLFMLVRQFGYTKMIITQEI